MIRASNKLPLLLLPGDMDARLENRAWLDCAAAWHRNGGQVKIAAPAGPMITDFARCGIPHTPLPTSASLLRQWHRGRALAEIINHDQPTEIWLRDISEWRFLRRHSMLARRHRLLLEQPLAHRQATHKLLHDFLMQDGTIVATSACVAQLLKQDFGLADDQVQLLLPAIDPKLFDPTLIRPDRALKLANDWRVPENATLFLHVGDLRPDGGQISLLHALAQSGRRDVFAVILGRDNAAGYHQKLLDATHHYGLAGQVMFAEDCPDLPAALWLAQAVVAANRTPAGANPVLLAAQAMGRPVLVSDAGANLELVSPGHSAWVYPAADAQALHDAMVEILSLGEKTRLQHGQRARAWVSENFPYDAWLKLMLGNSETTSAAEQAA